MHLNRAVARQSRSQFPQLYVHGSLIGGVDIVAEMKAEGNLKEQLELSDDAPAAAPEHSGWNASSRSVVISGNPGIMSPVELDIAGVTSRD